MFKNKRILVVFSVFMLLSISLWASFGPLVMARVSEQRYRANNYYYDVSIDTFYNTETKERQTQGIEVAIHPNLSETNSSQFSAAYLEDNQGRLTQWLTEVGEQTVDVMVIFSRPLTMDKANFLLESANATVFESGAVGYVRDIPFASYAIEEGTSLSRSLEDIAHAEAEAAVALSEGAPPTNDTVIIDVRGYLAVRIWTDREGLEKLSESELVRMIDITPQLVRTQLSNNRHWQNMPIHSLALEMPVWAYEW
ncbi:MAG: hypothetical protein CSB13_07965 [Chloroflexi bacterium]|nr:MAG: hypothetical protein CSB13_07965 [Chloroflexota bacterium]